MHLLLHLPDSVKSLGPLWAHSSFPFEGMNGWLSELYHGTRDPQKQVYQQAACVIEMHARAETNVRFTRIFARFS